MLYCLVHHGLEDKLVMKVQVKLKWCKSQFVLKYLMGRYVPLMPRFILAEIIFVQRYVKTIEIVPCDFYLCSNPNYLTAKMRHTLANHQALWVIVLAHACSECLALKDDCSRSFLSLTTFFLTIKITSTEHVHDNYKFELYTFF